MSSVYWVVLAVLTFVWVVFAFIVVRMISFGTGGKPQRNSLDDLKERNE